MHNEWLHRAVPIFIGFVFVLIICLWVAFGIAGFKVLKSMEGCTPALITKQDGGQAEYTVGCKSP